MMIIFTSMLARTADVFSSLYSFKFPNTTEEDRHQRHRTHLTRVGPSTRQNKNPTFNIPERSAKLRPCSRRVMGRCRGVIVGVCRGVVGDIGGVVLYGDRRVADGQLLQVQVAVAPGRGPVVVSVEGLEWSALVHLAGGGGLSLIHI